MLSNHGKQYKNKIEAMSNRKIKELNNDLLDLSTNTFDIINNTKYNIKLEPVFAVLLTVK